SCDRESSQTAAFADHAWLLDRQQLRYRVFGQTSFLRPEVGHQLSAVRELRPDVVIVDRLLNQSAGSDQRVDRGGRRVSLAKQRRPVALTNKPLSNFNARVGPDYLQVEHRPAGTYCFDHVV